ncbi:hypothetical protein H2203_005241 [Taxawa tesnikishii (nom. ined.)]|nr:hypothetical protein H2203_005241 [Dothideales sp. JES 119]
MDRYNISRSLVGPGLVDDTANALALRSDIHLSFDANTFIFTRKLDQWVSHFLTPTLNLGPEYHNTTVGIPNSVHPAFLLARLAWAIFPSIRNFLLRGEKRLVKLKQGAGDISGIRELQRDELCCVLGISPRGRSNSPKKRQRADDTGGSAGYDANAAKRARLGIADSAQPTTSPGSPPATTPSLCSVDVAATSLPTQPYELVKYTTSDAEEEVTERRRFAALRQRALKAQRPSKPELYCCDYKAAEQAYAAGIEGPRKYGGAQLCMECLGAEHRDEEG